MSEIFLKIPNITSEYNQIIQIPLLAFNSTDTLQLTLRFSNICKKWFCDLQLRNINDVVKLQINGTPLLSFRPLLNAFSNNIPFDLYIATNDTLNPITENAFSDGNASDDNVGLFLINQEAKISIFGQINEYTTV